MERKLSENYDQSTWLLFLSYYGRFGEKDDNLIFKRSSF